MRAEAKMKYVRISAQKARLVADQIRGQHVEQALNTLAFSTKKGAALIKKVEKGDWGEAKAPPPLTPPKEPKAPEPEAAAEAPAEEAPAEAEAAPAE